MANVTDNATSVLFYLIERDISLSIPVLCLITLFVTIGTVGNALVLMTYFRRVGKTSTNLFIFSLATFDILNCCIGLPFEMHDLLNPYTNTYGIMCKLHKFIQFSADFSSGCIIVCISFDRFMRIARPHRGFSLPHAKRAVILVSIISVLVSSMALYVYGTEQFVIESHPDITGSKCGINEHAKQTVVPLLFYTTLLVGFGVGVVILFTVYTRLGFKVRKWNRGRREVRRDQHSTLYTHGYAWKDESSSRGADTPDWKTDRHTEMFAFPPVVFEEPDDCDNDAPSPTRTQNTFKADFVRQISRSLNECNLENLDLTGPTECAPRDFTTKNNNIQDFKSRHTHDNGSRTLPLPRAGRVSIKPTMKNIRRKSSMMTLNDLRRKMQLTKTTIMFMVATIAFVVSHIPYMCVTIANMVLPDIDKDMSPTRISFYRIAWHSYIMSYAVNPLIYSFMNPKFRKECKTLILNVIQKVKGNSKSFDLRD